MLKKILYSIVAIVIGFVVFYISWRDSCSRAFSHRANKALQQENFEFFLKVHKYYEKEPIATEKYTETVVIDEEHNITDNNTTTLRVYNIYSTFYISKEESGKTVTVTDYRSGIYFLITDINTDIVPEEDSDPDDDSIVTKIILTADNGNTYTLDSSTFGYSSTPYISSVFASKEMKEQLIDDSHQTAPTKITHVKMVTKESKDSTDEVIFFDNYVEIPLEEHNEEDYWKNLVEQGKAGVLYTEKEYRDNFVFAFPEMTRTFVITGVTFIVLLALGLFVFWPKKSFVPKEDEDREKYTFATTDEKEKYALAKVAKGKKEKEDRENRYKNVRTEKSLDEITEEKLEESKDKENTFEQAVEEDKALEENNEDASTSNETIENEETKEEE